MLTVLDGLGTMCIGPRTYILPISCLEVRFFYGRSPHKRLTQRPFQSKYPRGCYPIRSYPTRSFSLAITAVNHTGIFSRSTTLAGHRLRNYPSLFDPYLEAPWPDKGGGSCITTAHLLAIFHIWPWRMGPRGIRPLLRPIATLPVDVSPLRLR